MVEIIKCGTSLNAFPAYTKCVSSTVISFQNLERKLYVISSKCPREDKLPGELSFLLFYLAQMEHNCGNICTYVSNKRKNMVKSFPFIRTYFFFSEKQKYNNTLVTMDDMVAFYKK